MLIVLSPAKRLDFERAERSLPLTQPALSQDAAGLMKVSKGLKPQDLQDLMGISSALAELNHERFQDMDPKGAPERSKPAALAFKGDVYQGLDADTLSDEDLRWSQTRMGILSGLYGILRPLDMIQPYRLEMGTRLDNPRGSNLYKYWGNRVSNEVHERLKDHESPVVVNLASNEYFNVLKRGQLESRVITPVFKEHHKGKLKVISFNAKRARGLMARWIIQERIENPARLVEFDLERFTYQADLSEEDTIVFTRTFVSAKDNSSS